MNKNKTILSKIKQSKAFI